MKLAITHKLKDTPTIGIVYVLEIRLEDETVVKVGMTTGKVEHRVADILTEMWKRYRYFPWCKVHRFTKTSDPIEKEAEIHHQLKDYSYSMQHSFGGCTEFFKVDLEVVKKVYDGVVKSANNK